ncbi:alanine--tRNA ligase [Candidatus Woesebacteria bacterium]|nr:alanine--tRNA ligase [Candidatus Woesebacteria bacterium]
MTSDEIREKFIKFFEKRGHKHIPSSPLVPENDPTTLFVSAGMQPLVPYILGKDHPEGKRLVNSQPSLRLEDIEEVGDNRHTTFFEMLGNWSLGDYFKEEQLSWFYEFLTKELGLPKEKLYVTLFEGGDGVAKDEESAAIWKNLGIPEDRIFWYGVDNNWWSRSGTPDNMVEGDIGGPDSEVFYDFGTKHDPKYGKECHPNCDCGRFLEIGNSVFIEYKKTKSGLEELPQKSVDFGGGLERLAAAVKGDSDVFAIDLFSKMISDIEEWSGKKYSDPASQPAMRVIADHTRASIALVKDGVLPANKLHGYILRRLLRRAAVKMHALGSPVSKVADLVDEKKAQDVIGEELERFAKSLDRGMKEVGKIKKIDGKIAFDLYQSYGFPLEITEELFEEKGQKIDHKQFEKEFKKHQDLSRTASGGMFKGGLAEDSPATRKLHTATHLLHQSLRTILGKHVEQKGSNITSERLRFDFSHPKALGQEEVKKVEDLMNEKIKEGLPVTSRESTYDAAIKEGALAFFGEKYGDRVKVYSISPSTGASTELSRMSSGQVFSKEVCGGPHVDNTKELGHVKITKEESAGAGVRRIYAVISDK